MARAKPNKRIFGETELRCFRPRSHLDPPNLNAVSHAHVKPESRFQVARIVPEAVGRVDAQCNFHSNFPFPLFFYSAEGRLARIFLRLASHRTDASRRFAERDTSLVDGYTFTFASTTSQLCLANVVAESPPVGRMQTRFASPGNGFPVTRSLRSAREAFTPPPAERRVFIFFVVDGECQRVAQRLTLRRSVARILDLDGWM